jgi:hypothetical protein
MARSFFRPHIDESDALFLPFALLQTAVSLSMLLQPRPEGGAVEYFLCPRQLATCAAHRLRPAEDRREMV